MEFDNRSIEITGSFYLYDDWMKGDFYLESGASIGDQWINYDVEFDLLEVKLEKEIKVVPLTMLRQFVGFNGEGESRLFTRCSNFFYEQSVPMTGVCEVLDSNFYGLIIRYMTDVKEASYVPALDMGKKEDEHIIKREYYLTSGTRVMEIPGKKQAFYALYPVDQNQLIDFIKKNKLNFRKESDLIKILEFINLNQKIL